MTETPSASDCRAIADLMSEVTREVLWLPWRQTSGERTAGTLNVRTGAGRATWHRFDHRTGHHTISFGSRMVADKRCPERSAGWLSSREIQARGYWQGQLSMLNLLAHTCCHEFAHLQQQCLGARQRGSVHNATFYRLLDQLYACGAAQQVRTVMQSRARARGITIDTDLFSPAASPRPQDFVPGQSVRFGHPGRERTGRVVTINRKTCTVACDDRRSARYYRVPPALMRCMASG